MQGYYNRGLYQEATQYVDSLKDNRYVNGQVYYFFARIYSLNNEFDKSLFYLEKMVKLGTTKAAIERMYDLDKFRNSHLNIVFELNYDKWHQEYVNAIANLNLDSTYIKEIELIKNIANKTKYKRVETIDGDIVYELKDSIDILEVEKQDSLNFEKLTELILEKGFPTYKKIGGAAFDALNLIKYKYIAEVEKESFKWKKIKPFLLEELEKGRLKPFVYGQLKDRVRVYKEEPQIYLTSLNYTNDDKVENPEELNIRRKSIGLCPIEIEFWSLAKELPLSLQEIKFK